MQEQPTSALPVVDAQAAGLLPDLELDLGPKGGAPPAPPAPPSAPKRAHPPAIKRQDTPTEMYAQGVHDSPSTADIPDLGDLVSSPITADAPNLTPGSPPGPSPARPSPPARPAPPTSNTSDDDSTSVLDLDALKAASVAKAAAAKTTPPPPAFGVVAPGTLPPGATETMRLDLESPSGPMPLQKLGLEGISLDLGSLPEPPKPIDSGPVREAPAFDPSQIGLADGRSSMPGPASIPGPASPRGPISGQPQHPYGAPPGPASTGAPQPVPSDAPRVKPAWQGAVDQGMVSVSRSTTEAIARFFVWFRKLNTGEQTTFIVCTVLGFLIMLMLMVYVVIY